MHTTGFCYWAFTVHLVYNLLAKYFEGLCDTPVYVDDSTLRTLRPLQMSTDQLALRSYISLNMAYHYCHPNDLVNITKTNQLAFGRNRYQVPAIREQRNLPRIKVMDCYFPLTGNTTHWQEGLATSCWSPQLCCPTAADSTLCAHPPIRARQHTLN